MISLIRADARRIPLADESVQCVVTSPPYWGLRKYAGDQGAEPFGLEPTVEKYVETSTLILREIQRVLRKDGVLFWNIGDTYAAGGHGWNNQGGISQRYNHSAICGGPRPRVAPEGLKRKDLCLIPFRVALAAQADGWYVRQDIIWNKPNPMPESVTDRCTKAHEYIFMFTKSERYYWNQEAILEPVSPNTHLRLSRNVVEQMGSARAHAGGKTNGNMKAVGRQLPGNKTHRGAASYEAGDESHRTKGGLVKYAEKIRKLAEPGSGIKNNTSFNDACCLPVERRNRRSVWEITTQPYKGAHFATFPEEIPRTCILAASRPGDLILDPFGGSGTTGRVAIELGRRAVLLDIAYTEGAYKELAEHRISEVQIDLLAAANA